MSRKSWFVLLAAMSVLSWGSLPAAGSRHAGRMGPGDMGDRNGGICDKDHATPRGDHHRLPHPGPGSSCLVLEFDADMDGVLNEEERSAADAAIEAALVERFDEDMDGVLSDDERAAACETLRGEQEAAREAKKAELLEEFDADGDGELNEEELAASRAAKEAELLAKFDADGNGELDEEELAAAREARCEAEGLPLLKGCGILNRPHPGDGGHPGHDGPGKKPGRHGHRIYPCLVIEFDADGDGKLNEEELAAARAAKEAELLDRFDLDGDGILSEEERDNARETLHQEREARRAEEYAKLLEEFDGDGDGKLNREELETARAAKKAELLAEFDADEDGVLNKEELAAARAARCEDEEMNEEDEEGEAAMAALVLSQNFLRGDANMDDMVDLSDAIKVIGFLFFGQVQPPCMDAADASDDGTVDITDPIKVLTVLFLGEGSLPEPNLVAGEDPTMDALTCDG